MSFAGLPERKLQWEDEDRPPVTLVLNKIDKASEMRWAVELSRRFYSCLPVDPW